jgi:hypothetical protein
MHTLFLFGNFSRTENVAGLDEVEVEVTLRLTVSQ